MNSNESKGGISFAGLLTVLFIALKLVGVIKWSWVWVLSPLWIGAVAWVVIVAIALVVMKARGRK